MRTGAKNVRARPFSHTKTDFGDWSWKEKILINHISNNNKKFQQHWSVHMRTGAKKRTCADVFSRARLFSHSNMHCRDYAWKDKILNDHLSNNNNKNSATSGRACAHKSRKHTCAAVFSLARPFSHSKMHFRDLSQTEKILINNISNRRMCFK
jgi:hypothetical protein